MIHDCIANCGVYSSVNPSFPAAFRFLSRPDLADLPAGRYEIDERGAHALVSEYRTRNAQEAVIECHRRYIDIQYMVRGEERIGYCPKSGCNESSYDAQKDFQTVDGPVAFLPLRPGLFAVLFPQDGHMPGVCADGTAEAVKKVVVKAPV